MMPDHGSRMKAQGPALLLQAPAHIDIVACGPKLDIKAADRFQGAFPEGHIAPGEMLRDLVGKQYMHRAARSIGHTVRNGTVARWGPIRTSDPRMIRAPEGLDQIVQPMRIRPRVVIKIRDEFPRGLLESGIARAAEPTIFRADDSAVVSGRDRPRRIRGAIIDHDDLVVRIFYLADPLQAVPDGARAIKTAHHDRHAWAGLPRHERNLCKSLANDGQRELGPTVSKGQAKIPVIDVMPAAVPLVGPPEHERAGASGRKGGVDLPLEHLCLIDFAVPTTIQPDFSQQQRPVPGKILKPGQVRFQTILGLEVHVEAHQVEKRQVQIFGRGIVHIRHEPVRVLFFRGMIESFQVTLDRAAAVPSHDGCRDFVPDGVAENRRMPRTGAHAGPQPLLDPPGQRAILQEGDVLLPGQADHHMEAVRLGHV